MKTIKKVFVLGKRNTSCIVDKRSQQIFTVRIFYSQLLSLSFVKYNSGRFKLLVVAA